MRAEEDEDHCNTRHVPRNFPSATDVYDSSLFTIFTNSLQKIINIFVESPLWIEKIPDAEFKKLRGKTASRGPATNQGSFKKMKPNFDLDKLVKKFANSNSNLQISRVSRKS